MSHLIKPQCETHAPYQSHITEHRTKSIRLNAPQKKFLHQIKQLLMNLIEQLDHIPLS